MNSSAPANGSANLAVSILLLNGRCSNSSGWTYQSVDTMDAQAANHRSSHPCNSCRVQAHGGSKAGKGSTRYSTASRLA